MAHFARLDDNNIVLEVNVVNNTDIDPNNEEASGIAFLTAWSGGYINWKQTSYTGTSRKNFAGIGYLYDPVLDAFIAPQPFPSWYLNEETCQWEAPVDYPTDGLIYTWDEDSLDWSPARYSTPSIPEGGTE